jgi:hypothetical protein
MILKLRTLLSEGKSPKTVSDRGMQQTTTLALGLYYKTLQIRYLRENGQSSE